jgi:PAS domain S-box-containing protein
MQASEQWAQLIVDSALDAIVTADREGRILAWNRRAEEMFGWSAEEAIGRTMTETILPPDRVEVYRSGVEELLSGNRGYGYVRSEGSSRDRCGRVFPVEVATAAIPAGDETVIVNFVRDLTREHASLEELREKNELLKALVDGLPLAVTVTDAEGRVALWNTSAETMFGWSSAEVLGKPLPTVPSDGLDGFLANRRRVFAGETLRDFRVAALRRDGTEFEVNVTAAPIYDGDGTVCASMGIITDLTDQNRVAAQLRETNQLLQALLEATPLPITVIDTDGNTTLWNPAAERLFGWTAEEVLGGALPIVPPEEVEDFAIRRARVAAGETLTDVPLRRRRRDGTPLDISLSAAPIRDSEGNVSATVGIYLDVTERLRAFELLRNGDAERRSLLSKLVRAQEDERQRIAADIHDDSVQVLTALALRLEMLRRKTDDPAALESLAEALRTARLAVTRLRHLMFELRPPVLDRDGLAAALLMHIEQAKQDYGVEFVFEDRLEDEPEGDTRALVYRIAQEALVNAVKHAQASTVKLLLQSRGGVLVRISDDGRGFDPAVGTGTHVGLVAMRERAEMTGGWCRVESAPGQGTVVEFFVPSSTVPAAERVA